jgi:hypothetical protein
MAYSLTITMDQLIVHVLAKLGVIPAGGAASEAQEAEAEWAIQIALKSLDASNMYTRNTKETSVIIAANNYAGVFTAVTGVHSVLGGMLQLDGAPSYYSPIEYVPLQKLGSLGSPYISSVPSKFSVVLNEVPVTGQPDAVGGSKVLLNGSVRVASHMII